MGKRSDLGEKRPRDYWPTIDPDAIKPLLPFVRGLSFAEPCAGAGDLLNMLNEAGVDCRWASDLEPQVDLTICTRDDGTVHSSSVVQKNALELTTEHLKFCNTIITNPPFTWALLQPLLDHLPTLKETWLLLPADVIHNRRMAPYMEKCNTIVSVGRLYWLPNKIKGVDNFVWLCFDYNNGFAQTVFYGRT